jgi:hypothetical protein
MARELLGDVPPGCPHLLERGELLHVVDAGSALEDFLEWRFTRKPERPREVMASVDEVAGEKRDVIRRPVRPRPRLLLVDAVEGVQKETRIEVEGPLQRRDRWIHCETFLSRCS